MKLELNDYDFFLPKSSIALYPSKERENCKLLYTKPIHHFKKETTFNKITDFFHKNDVLVINNTMVDKARLYATSPSHQKHEILLLKPCNEEKTVWEAKVKNRKRINPFEILTINEKYSLVLKEKFENDLNVIEFNVSVTNDVLDQIAELPLPPYIINERQYNPQTDINDYQTVFHSHQYRGSKACPTAGLHFTDALLLELKEKGVIIVPIQLFVSLGTFNPITVPNILDHTMHFEDYHITEHTAESLNKALQENRRIIACGTTSLRTLESAFTKEGYKSGYGSTNLFVNPNYQLKVVNALITNFHTPKSSLLVLVSTLMGYDFMSECYDYAIHNHYRFFSYGDAMMIDGLNPSRID